MGSLAQFPFYVHWHIYIEFVTSKVSTLVLSDDALFVGWIIVNVAYIFFLYLIIKLIKFVVLLGKNLILR